MGFYGNISNVNKTNMTFDKIYSNRKSMDESCALDGVYAGRYVLVEYEQYYPLDTLPIIYKLSSDKEEKFSTTYTQFSPLNIQENVIYRCVILTNWLNGVIPEEDLLLQYYSNTFYRGVRKDGVLSLENMSSEISEENYVGNFNIDRIEYNTSRGYDSTVWMKQYDSNGIPRYVNIAELNSVVPTFDVSVDAPTEIPNSPHFDEDSTNIYYNLHVQPQWGFRVKSAENSSLSDVEVNGDKKAIYFNKAGFQRGNKNAYANLNTVGADYINITPTGVSGQLYNSHKKGEPKKTAPDIQELSIHLPSIGNMMSDAWDIIHGPERDNSPADSLQGRLNFFKDKIKTNAIPVQSPGNYLVGSTIIDDTWVNANINIPNTSNLPDNDENKYHVAGIALTHKTVDGFKDSQNNTMTNQSPSFGSSFNIPVITVDKAGHITSLAGNSSVQLPQGSLTINDETNNVSKVITDLSFTPATGSTIAKNRNVGELLLTGYEQNENGYITAQNSINQAFKALDAQAQEYSNSITAINDANNGILAQAKTYADSIKTSILGEGIKDTFDTLVEIQTWIEGDGINAKELADEMAKIPSWAKENTKPTYTAEEVGALPANTVIPTIPTNISAFNNDVGYLTEHQSLKTLEDKITELENRIAQLENPTTTE